MLDGIYPAYRHKLYRFNTPPAAVVNIMKVVFTIFGISDTPWAGMRAFLQKKENMTRITSFKPRWMSKNVRNTVGDIVQQNADSFKEETARNSSKTVIPLAQSVQACVLDLWV